MYEIIDEDDGRVYKYASLAEAARETDVNGYPIKKNRKPDPFSTEIHLPDLRNDWATLIER